MNAIVRCILWILLSATVMNAQEAAKPVTEAMFRLTSGGFIPVGKNEPLKSVLAGRPKLDFFETAALGTRQDLDSLLGKDANRVRARNEFGWTALHMAAFAGNVDNMRLLLDRGADLHSRAGSRFRNTPLQVALLTGEYEAAKLLIERGADVLDRQAEGFAPIHEAASLGRADLVQLLLDHGAEVNSMSDDGRTALSEAKRRKHAAVVALLKAKGAVERADAPVANPE